MSVRMSRMGLAAGCLLLVALLVLAVGCSSDEPGASTTSVSGQTSTTGEASTTTTISLLTEWDKKLRDNSTVQHNLALYLTDQGVADDDPAMGLYFGLQARTRALTCRKALAEEDLELADTGMLEVYYALNRGRNVATGSTAETIAAAYAIVETLGSPSDRPEEAAALLDRFIDALVPLKDEATGILSTTTTTTASPTTT